MKPSQNISILHRSAIALAKQFAQKHDYEYGGYVDGGNITAAIGYYNMNDYVVSIDTIIVDMNLDVPKDVFVQYYDYVTDYLHSSSDEDEMPMNYQTWLKTFMRL